MFYNVINYLDYSVTIYLGDFKKILYIFFNFKC